MTLDEFKKWAKKATLPDAPGVYFFEGKKDGGQKIGQTKKQVLYIGRATSLKDRVRSYFSDDLIHTRGPLLIDMVTQADGLDFIQTSSVLEAIILEANLIKKHQPHFNTKEKDDKSFNYVVITAEKFPRVFTMRGKDIEARQNDGAKTQFKTKYIFGPYTNGALLKDGLKIVRRIFPFRDMRCQISPAHAPCFNRQIGLCPGVCTGEISARDYAAQIRKIALFFEGKKSRLMSSLTREMNTYAKSQQFEQAHRVKKTLFALEHIQDVSLIRDEDQTENRAQNQSQNPIFKAPEALFRIEAYDIAHLSGSNMVGVMTVIEGKELCKEHYRKFKIRTRSDADDTGALREILSRRLSHSEWTYPNLIVVDGSVAQKNAAEALLRERGFDIAVVAVVKNDRHRPDRVLGDKEMIEKYMREILLLNSEAHRFAIKYHRSLRSLRKIV